MYYPYSQSSKFPFPLREDMVASLKLKVYQENSYSMTYTTQCKEILVKIDILAESYSSVFCIVRPSISYDTIYSVQDLIRKLAFLNYLPAVQILRKDKIDEILKELEL